ncbi:glycoside hydrolase family 6 protein [Streptomyces sp. HSG2]|uniref:glycoside hydrolase family 6 protein n=1 Tax=Streptomyces sp. HSG2 TaxID=2797167 RepID=UPI001904D023|nr:glycoside hydrolase family 6 protein [Streptomyces sp. HSG2]
MDGTRGVGRIGGARVRAAAVGAVLLLAGCSDADAGDAEGDGAPARQPAGSAPYWVNPEGTAARELAELERDGRDEEADLIRRIAERPVAEWISPEEAEAQSRGFTEAAAAVDRTALLVLYNIPHRDCGQYSQGGAVDGAAYRAFVEAVAEGIDDRPATVILEPDAVLHLVDGCTPEVYHEERYALLREAIATLKALPDTTVYLDAGNAGWGEPDQIFEPLRWAGVERADGFSVNVSNYYTTEDSIAYGKELSAKVGGKPFVIDTSRNGNGPYTGGDASERWCNPPGRALGEAPTRDTADPLVDAYLWIKRPGESDGECKGGPKAGEWWPEYALGLARSAN